MKKLLITTLLGLPLVILSGCRSVPSDISGLIQQKQIGLMWIAPNKKLILNNENGSHEQINHDKLTAEFNVGGDYVWSADPSIVLTGKAGSFKINIPTEYLEEYGKAIPANISGQSYEIRLFRILKPTKEWIESRTSDTPIYITTYNADGSMSQTLAGYDTDYYDDYYMDGSVEYRLAFYDHKKEVVGIFFMTKPVLKLLKKTVRTG